MAMFRIQLADGELNLKTDLKALNEDSARRPRKNGSTELVGVSSLFGACRTDLCQSRRPPQGECSADLKVRRRSAAGLRSGQLLRPVPRLSARSARHPLL